VSVGVIITCHNEEPWIGAAIASALDQTQPSHRVVVVDDGSADGSPHVIRAWAAREPRLDFLRVSGRGMAAARNAGIMALGDCEWVVHLDGDDWLDPNFIAEASKHAPGHDAVVTSIVRVGKTRPTMPAPATLAGMLERCTLHSCAMFRRDALVEVGGFRSDLGGDCDWGLWVELLARGVRIAYCPTTAYHYRRREGSLTQTETAADRSRHHALIRGLA
jgi:glycosyltransferase involved in cell wall biosynthesis